MGETPYSMEAFYLTQTLLGMEETPLEQSDRLDRITREDVAAAAALPGLDTVYVLTGQREEAEAHA